MTLKVGTLAEVNQPTLLTQLAQCSEAAYELRRYSRRMLDDIKSTYICIHLCNHMIFIEEITMATSSNDI